MPRLIVPLLAALLALAWAGRAAAAPSYGKVVLDLKTDAGEVPTHLCVASLARSTRANRSLADFLAPTSEPGPGATQPIRARSWLVLPEAWGTVSTAESKPCTDDADGDCRPRIELPENVDIAAMYAACTSDDGLASPEDRPVFVLLEYLEGSPPQIQSMRLAGGVATIGVLGPNFDQVTVTARSIGGYYLAQQRSERASPERDTPDTVDRLQTKSLTLELTNRCRLVEVKLPRTRVGPADRDRLSVRIHGQRSKCISNLVGSEVIQVRIPPAPLGVGSIDVVLAPDAEGRGGARYGGSYEGSWPKEPFALEFNQITFSWRRPECIYPVDRCPAAALQNGTTCGATVTDTGCDYRCPGVVTETTGNAHELPLEVTFEKSEPRQRWRETLAQNGQELSSYVPADQIYLTANIHSWHDPVRVPDNRITHVELYGEDGSPRRYAIERLDTLVLRVPGATCEPILFRPFGSRRHGIATAEVQDGRIGFGDDPHRRAQRASFNVMLALGGGPAWSDLSGGNAAPPLYFSGLAMVGVEVRPRRRHWQRLGFEFRAGGTLGTWGKFRSGQETRIGWARVLFETGLVASLHDRVALGLGVGLGFSLPFRDEDEEVTNDSLNFIWSPSTDLRFKITRWLRLVLQFRGVFGEKAFSIGTTESASSGPPADSKVPLRVRPNQLMAEVTDAAPRKGEKARSLLTLFGIQASF